MPPRQLVVAGAPREAKIAPPEGPPLEQEPEGEVRAPRLEAGTCLERAERPPILGGVPDGEAAAVEPAAQTIFLAHQHTAGIICGTDEAGHPPSRYGRDLRV